MKYFFVFIWVLILQGCGCNYHVNQLKKKGCYAVETRVDTLYTIVPADSVGEVKKLQPNKEVVDAVDEVLNICDSIIYTYKSVPVRNKYADRKKQLRDAVATKCPEIPPYSFKYLGAYWSRVTYNNGVFKHEIGRVADTLATVKITNMPVFQEGVGVAFYKNTWFWLFIVCFVLLVLRLMKR